MKRLEEIAFFTSDVDRTVRFYERLLGIEAAVWQRGETATFLLGEVKLFLHQKGEPFPDGPRDEDHVAFLVEDVDEECEGLKANGLAIEVGPRDFYWGRSAYLRDPDGRLVELHRPPDRM